ncbi:MAG: hypothetical protein IJ747_00615 [Lachnospiraceae bacterium]|nr:hypothetical protein [Lachnospiraceae bacterium]
MTNWFDLTNFATSAGGLAIVLLSFILIRIVPYMERWVRKYFTVFFHILAAYILFDMLSQISLLLLGDRFALLSRVAIGLESFFSSIMMPLLTLYLLRCVREDWRKASTFYIVGGPSAAGLSPVSVCSADLYSDTNVVLRAAVDCDWYFFCRFIFICLYPS